MWAFALLTLARLPEQRDRGRYVAPARTLMRTSANFRGSALESDLAKTLRPQRTVRNAARASMKDGVRFPGYQGITVQVVWLP